jgi:cytochrome c oxidase subunit 2
MSKWLALFPESASSMAGRVDALYFYLVIVSGFFSLLIAGLIVYFAIKYRRRRPNEIGAPIAGDLRLEATWIVIPAILEMIMFVWGASVYFAHSTLPSEFLEIYVVGKQWMWKFQHEDGQREINELHVPVGRNIKLTMATEDVIHSFFVPAFRVKADVVPGRYNSTWFRATKPGRYRLFCAEYCGTNHSLMGGWVYVMAPADYEAWLSGGPVEGTLADAGQKLFQQLACNTCHRSDTQGRGPRLDGLYGSKVQLADGREVIADESYLRTCILTPRATPVAGFRLIMPSFKGLVSEEQLLQLVAYIKSLGPPPDAAAPSGSEAVPPRSNQISPQRETKKP